MKFSIVWTQIAATDLQNIVCYIANDDLINAEKTRDAIVNAAGKLESFPERGRLVPELKKQNIHRYQEIIYNVWRIVYTVTGESVFIFGIFDSRRNLNDLIIDRFS